MTTATIGKDDLHRAAIMEDYSEKALTAAILVAELPPHEVAVYMLGLGFSLAAHMHPEEAMAWALAFTKRQNRTAEREYDADAVERTHRRTFEAVEELRGLLASSSHEGECEPYHEPKPENN